MVAAAAGKPAIGAAAARRHAAVPASAATFHSQYPPTRDDGTDTMLADRDTGPCGEAGSSPASESPREPTDAMAAAGARSKPRAWARGAGRGATRRGRRGVASMRSAARGRPSRGRAPGPAAPFAPCRTRDPCISESAFPAPAPLPMATAATAARRPAWKRALATVAASSIAGATAAFLMVPEDDERAEARRADAEGRARGAVARATVSGRRMSSCDCVCWGAGGRRGGTGVLPHADATPPSVFSLIRTSSTQPPTAPRAACAPRHR
jgi:hypothetical protein